MQFDRDENLIVAVAGMGVYGVAPDGRIFKVTRERIRQIESKTMSKLRHPSRSQVLRDYLD